MVLISAYCLIILYFCTKFHENNSMGFRVTQRTENHDGQTDRWTDKVITLGPPQTSSGGALKNFVVKLESVTPKPTSMSG